MAGLSLVAGMISGMQTFCGQAYGAKRYGTLGVILQRALLLTAATALPCVCFWSQADHVFVLLGERRRA